MEGTNTFLCQGVMTIPVGEKSMLLASLRFNTSTSHP